MQILQKESLRHLVAPPPIPEIDGGRMPVLCFLHGLCEAAPMEIRQALRFHGPLRHRAACHMIQRFAFIAPQLPSPQSRWRYHVDEVLHIVRDAQSSFYGDLQRAYLTGFSYGADAVFKVAQAAPDLWAALWAVDPQRVVTQPGTAWGVHRGS